MKRALFVGRFQPPHLGHLEVIKHILNEVDELIIVIAAAQVSHTIKNPFTVGERLQMVRLMLDNAKIDRRKYWLIPVPDIFDNPIWVTHIVRYTPPFDVFYSNNPFTTMLFREKNRKTKSTVMFNRDLYEGKQIRENIRDGKSIEKMVDDGVIKLIEEWNMRKRLEALHGVDSLKSKSANSNFQVE